MKCINCGNEIAENSAFCTFCGSPVSSAEQPEAPLNAVHQKMLDIFKDKLFLALCILVSASAGFSLISGNVPLLRILFTIFLWLIYAKAAKNMVDIKNMRNVSGTVFASYVVTWVLIGLLGLVCVIGFIAFVVLGNSPEITSIMSEILTEAEYSIEGFDEISSLMLGSGAIIIMAIGIIALFVIGIAVALINVFGMGSIHKFTKSLYSSAEIGDFRVEKLNTAKNWLLVFGILNCITAVSSISDFKDFIANGCVGAVYILAYILVKKHFFAPQELN